MPIKHESLWPAHLTSKQHRSNALAEQQKQEDMSRKRALEEAEEHEAKRARLVEAEQREEPEAPTEEAPADIGSKLRYEASTAGSRQSPAVEAEEEDPEWAQFERDILAEPVASSSKATISGQPKIYDEEGQVPEEAAAPVPVDDVDLGGPSDETEEQRRQREENEELMQRMEECVPCCPRLGS
jgi:zinc finger protein 830